MLRLTEGVRDANPLTRLEPDRKGNILGLSLTGFHEVAYVDWGPIDGAVPVVCIHGLNRQGRDFDYLAAHLAALGRRVICPDLVGRGRSGRLRNPDEYALPQYCADMNALFARMDVKEVDWIGTSLGGMIGIVMAGLPGNSMRRLVINDIGPSLPWAGLARIGSYVSAMPADFRGLEEVEAYFRDVLAPFGDLSDEHWRHIARHSVAWNANRGRYVMLCDPDQISNSIPISMICELGILK
jgi:pimeloyl-ACP methyl ester carboxylesterase